MSDCSFNPLLQAYHDGQMSAERTRELEQHVSTCAACAAELARLRELSEMLSAVARPEPIRPMELARLHQAVAAVEDREDRRVLRFAGGLSAVAASILIISTAWLYDGPAGNPRIVETRPAGPHAPWERVAAGRPDQPPASPRIGTASLTNFERDRETTDWMIVGMKGTGEHGNP